MHSTRLELLDKIEALCKELETEFDSISQERKAQLTTLSDYISQKNKENKIPKLVVICTHNSRRSHIGQLWLAIAADYYQLPEVQTFSGGTEATAFNIRAVKAFEKLGLAVSHPTFEVKNPVYQTSWKKGMEPYQSFSKKYESVPNPQENFAAIMVCTEADKGCPLVSGCDLRLPLPYDDPKAFDDTDLEEEKYTERIRQIGREILFALSQVPR